MPGVAMHFVLADRVLSRWRSADPAVGAPFDADDPAALNAFYHGSVGPDLGYFPGGHRVLSDLAHCVRPAALARNLLALARTDVERAFALGWLTHVVADQTVHPILAYAVGELLTGSRDHFVDASTNLAAHMRVEVGLDAWYAERHPWVRARRLMPAFDGRRIGFLVRAYAATYGVPFPPALFRRCHRATTRRVGQALASLGLVSALMKSRAPFTVGLLRRTFRAAYRAEALRSLPLAYLNPVRPAPWLLDAVREVVAGHAASCLAHARDGAAALEDLNLDTGRPAWSEPEHPGTRRALEALEA